MMPSECVIHRANGDNLQLCLALDDTLMSAGRTWVRGLSHLLVIAFYGVCVCVCVCVLAKGDEGSGGRQRMQSLKMSTKPLQQGIALICAQCMHVQQFLICPE